jgi:glycosyltransferase involved in cell wall biosynthesis
MKINNPLVSVIMNCYNSDKYLKEAIESVLNQTYKNFEIIFWDNQSTDDSAKIVKSYGDDRIKYFYASSHTSLGEGRNKALKKTTGEFISFLDCDDLYLPYKLEDTLEYFTNKDIGLVYTNGYTLFHDKNITKEFYKHSQKSGDMFESWIASYQVMIPSVMFRKEVLSYLDYWFDSRFSMIEEFDFFVRISKNCKVNYSDEKLCIWRAHIHSLTWSKKELFEKENKLFLKDMLSRFEYLKEKECIDKFNAKISYQEFYNKWSKKNIKDRKILTLYLFVDKRLIIIYLLSFLNFKTFNAILKLIGKNV